MTNSNAELIHSYHTDKKAKEELAKKAGGKGPMNTYVRLRSNDCFARLLTDYTVASRESRSLERNKREEL